MVLENVETEMKRLCVGSWKEGENAIKCPFHEDKTASASYNSVKKVFYCHGNGCVGGQGIKGLARLLGFEGRYVEPEKEEGVEKKPLAKRLDVRKPDMFFRGIKPKVLKRLGCGMYTLHGHLMLYMPVIMKGKWKGYVSGYFNVEGKPVKFLNSTGLKAKRSLLFYDQVLERFDNDFVALVEGPRDALNLIQHGVPAVSLLGIGNWSRYKKDLLEKNFKRVYIMMDNDAAGIKGSKTINETLRCGRIYHWKGFEYGVDPGDLDRKTIKHIFNNGSNGKITPD